MSNERDRPIAQDGHLSASGVAQSGSSHVLGGQPRQVARVNMPDEPLGEAYDDSLDAGQLAAHGVDTPAAKHSSRGGGWSPTAWLLGVLALVISISVLLFIMQGVFQSMPK